MEDNRQLKRIKGVIAICIFAFFAVFALAVFSFVKIGAAKRQNAITDSYIASLESKKQELQIKIDETKESNYIDKQARNNFNMIRDGEIIYYFE